MSSIINLNENDIRRIVTKVLNEGAKEYMNIPKTGCEKYVPGKGCDPYRYLKVVDGSNTKYYFKKDQDKTWTQAKNISGITSIQKYITFNSKPETESKLNPNLPNNQENRIVQGNKMKINQNKIVNGTYSTNELENIVNSWKPTYDFNLKGKNDSEKKLYDWKINVDKTSNLIYDWRNKQLEKIKSNYSLSNNKKKEAENDILYLSTLVTDKLEKEYQDRWKGIA